MAIGHDPVPIDALPLVPGADPGGKAIEGLSLSRLALRRLLHDKPTLFSLVVVVLFLLMAVSAPILSAVGILNPTAYHNDLIDVNSGGLPNAKGGISWSHWLGVEPTTGRDVLSRIILGVTFSLAVALSAAILAVVIGILLGIISGYLGGWVDAIVSRIIDMTLSFPQTLMLIGLSGIFIEQLVSMGVPEGNTASGVYVILVLGLFGWPSFARLIRGQVLSQREREYIEAARAVYAWVAKLCVTLGADEKDLVSFEKYAAAAQGLAGPSSAARALYAGVPNIERVDRLVRTIAAQKGMRSAAVDEIAQLAGPRA